ncbi:MAG: DUF2817 domain-containing protein [Hydrogenovibrio sp.]|uniref:M14 family zinc carboxypeptidase n=1 Tax=Hydrogenovibrio sp. TaxID=2065821 RepID=UPI00286FAF93|nr:M14 family zinc carboxypeptidase [Hydrogenovibrio sp.]MDR9498468.1 DUF2817 domain-containing protein [Hydrogenovibrio sp.]
MTTLKTNSILALTVWCFYQAWSLPVLAETTHPPLTTPVSLAPERVAPLCEEWANKLRTVQKQTCLDFDLHASMRFESSQERPLLYKEVRPGNGQPPKGRILFIGGIHGDEYAAISITYLWLQELLKERTQPQYHWLFLPLANPDGLFQSPATRMNANGVDLNRNFPSPDWKDSALTTWQNHYGGNPRRYPGKEAASEPETQWMVQMIKRFRPDAIISVHAPYGLLDYDGPEHAQPNRIGHLKHRSLGTYPGSLGRYAGEHLNIPVLTLELRSAGRMPTPDEIDQMLKDLESWAAAKIRQQEKEL